MADIAKHSLSGSAIYPFLPLRLKRTLKHRNTARWPWSKRDICLFSPIHGAIEFHCYTVQVCYAPFHGCCSFCLRPSVWPEPQMTLLPITAIPTLKNSSFVATSL